MVKYFFSITIISIQTQEMNDFLETIRTHFNVVHQGDSVSLTLINSNISIDIIKEIRNHFSHLNSIRKFEVIILEAANFDDNLLVVLAESFPPGLTHLCLDFTGCESLKGSGFLDLFEKISGLDNLKKLHLDLGEVYDINDFVMEGFSMLLEALSGLTEFYLDLYEVDQITEDGYLMLAESLSHLSNLKKLHIDLSANPNLSQDALELMFSALPSQLQSLSFRILDIEHIGGGSFFKLAEEMGKMTQLRSVNLTISSFTNVNQKALYSIIKAIGQLQFLESLSLNFSNINLPQKMLAYLNFPKTLKAISLDVSCNVNLSDRDIVCLSSKIPVHHYLKSFCANFDFCRKISEDAIQSLLEKLFENKSLLKVSLCDRKYSPPFLERMTKILEESNCGKSMLSFNCGVGASQMKCKQLQGYRQYKEIEKVKSNIILASSVIKQNKMLLNYEKDIISLLVPHI